MLDNFQIAGKRLLVTGATSGIGLSMVKSFIKEGAYIIGLGRNQLKLEALELEFPDFFKGMAIDLSNIDLIENSLASLELNYQIDGFVHSAGILHRRPLKMISPELFQEIMNVNVISGGILVKYLYKNKIFAENASIVFISSVAAQYAAIGNIMYMSSKGAVNSMVKGLALELAQKNIRVNGIEPGLIITELTSGISDEEIEKVFKDYPLNRLGNTEDINDAVQFLLSTASSWITGQLLRVDGGLTLR